MRLTRNALSWWEELADGGAKENSVGDVVPSYDPEFAIWLGQTKAHGWHGRSFFADPRPSVWFKRHEIRDECALRIGDGVESVYFLTE